MVRFLADTSQVDKGVSSMGSKLKGFGQSLAGFIGGAALGAFAKSAVDAANDMTESLNKVNTVFGKSAASVRKFAEGAAENLGLSRQAALDASGAYGNMFTQLGFTTGAAADMSKVHAHPHRGPGVVPQRGPDRGARSATGRVPRRVRRGPEVHPDDQRRRGRTDAPSPTTGKTSNAELTAGEKAAAAYALMIEGAGSATGDFARTSGDAANQQRIMSAKMDDATVSIGQALQPALAVVVPWIAKAADSVRGGRRFDPESRGRHDRVRGRRLPRVRSHRGAHPRRRGARRRRSISCGPTGIRSGPGSRTIPRYWFVLGMLARPVALFITIIGGLKTLYDNWSRIWNDIKTTTQSTVDRDQRNVVTEHRRPPFESAIRIRSNRGVVWNGFGSSRASGTASRSSTAPRYDPASRPFGADRSEPGRSRCRTSRPRQGRHRQRSDARTDRRSRTRGRRPAPRTVGPGSAIPTSSTSASTSPRPRHRRMSAPRWSTRSVTTNAPTARAGGPPHEHELPDRTRRADPTHRR